MKALVFVTAWLLVVADVFGATALHHYTFDYAGVIDSVGSADGSLVGGASLSFGVLTLNGTNAYVQFGGKLIPPGNFSVTFFAQELSPTSDRAEVISQGSMFGPGLYFGYYPPGRSIRVGDQWQNTGLHFPADRLKHHYAVTTDAAGARLYIDGSCVATNSPIQVASGGNNTRFGQQFDPWGEFFHGSVDEVWVFSGALTAAEVARLAAAQSPGLSIEVSQVRLCWYSEADVLYQIEYCSELTTNQWVSLGTPIQGNGATNCITDDVTGPRRYYRMVALP